MFKLGEVGEKSSPLLAKIRMSYTNNNFNKNGMSTKSKFIMLGIVLSSVLILLTAFFVIDNTQKRLEEAYYSFGSMMAKTLAVESADMTQGLSDEKRFNRLRDNAISLVKSSDNISYIAFKNNSGEIIYSTKNSLVKPNSKDIEMSTPLYIKMADGQKQVGGSIYLGLTGKGLNDVSKTARNSMLIILTLAWIVSVLAVVVNTNLLTRQITLLVDGVKKISTGQFGYTLASKDLWGEVKHLFEAFNDMSARLRQYEEKNIDQLTYERNKLEAVLMSIANGVVVCDNFDKVILMNNAASKMLSIKSTEMIGSNVQKYCDSDGVLCFEDKISKFKNTPLEEMESKPLSFEININERIYQTDISPMFNLHQEYLGYIIVLHDVTKEAEVKKLKSNFISNVSHELRTPVTVLRSYVDTLFNYGGDFDFDTQKEFIGVINQEVSRLNNMVNDILDFSRLEATNIKLAKTPVNIEAIIDMTVSSMKILAEEKAITFSVIIEPDLPKINLNTDSIERALKNLLSNAIKYSQSGARIKVRAELDSMGENIEISVIDNGIGIPEKHLEKIFDRFYRVETAAHTIKGTGLGLHLVKIAIEKHHGGKVIVESKEGEGSTFIFRLPLVNDDIIENPKTEDNNETIIEENHEEVAQKDDEWELTIEKSDS